MQTAFGQEPDLAVIIQKYNSVTERLKRSHDALGLEVCRLREELNQKDKELQRRERLAALGEMAAGVAHEIRNPLGGIRLYASMLERDLIDQPEQLDMVKRLEVGVRNLDRVVGDILVFAGDYHPDLQVVLLSDILENVCALTAPQAAQRKIHLSFDTRLDSIELYCDAAQIERALINLIQNAIDAIPEQGQVKVRWSASELDEKIEREFCHICVEDNGSGIEPEKMQRVFNPFYTTKHTGTGLGLAIVNRIAESHGGRISVGSSSYGGAAFVLSVPLARKHRRAVDAGGK